MRGEWPRACLISLCATLPAAFFLGSSVLFGPIPPTARDMLGGGGFGLAAFAVYWIPLWVLLTAALAWLQGWQRVIDVTKSRLLLIALISGGLGEMAGSVCHHVSGPPSL